MPQISKQKKDKIKEQILHHLFEISPNSAFTNLISEAIARDEEFIKALLIELKAESLVSEINKNPKGKTYLKRQRWRLSNSAYQAYAKYQQQNNNNYNLKDLEETE